MGIKLLWCTRALAVALLGLGLGSLPKEALAAPASSSVDVQSHQVKSHARVRAKTATIKPRAKRSNRSVAHARKGEVARTTREAATWSRGGLAGAVATAPHLQPISHVSTDVQDDSKRDPMQLNSNAVLVVDRHSKAVLIGKNDSAVLPIASLTKLMTGLVVVDSGLPMDEVLTITADDVDRIRGSKSRLAVGTRLSRAEALRLALMSSENRAAHALGRTYPGGIPAFVAAMNRKAAALGMTSTRFVEPTGLSSDNQSTPRDVARLVSAAAERRLLRELTTSPEYELATGRRVVQFRNTNKLVRESEWDILLQKTGYIREAGRCVAMQVHLAGRDFIMVLMDAANSSARWRDAEHLLRWLQRSLVPSAA